MWMFHVISPFNLNIDQRIKLINSAVLLVKILLWNSSNAPPRMWKIMAAAPALSTGHQIKNWFSWIGCLFSELCHLIAGFYNVTNKKTWCAARRSFQTYRIRKRVKKYDSTNSAECNAGQWNLAKISEVPYLFDVKVRHPLAADRGLMRCHRSVVEDISGIFVRFN